MMHVPYKGAAPALTALLGNEAQVVALGAGVGAPYVKAGKLRALAVSGRARLRAFPDIPSFAEAGLAEDAAANNWWAVVAPADTPDAVVLKLREGLVKALSQPKVAARIEELGALPAPDTPEQMARRLQREALYWRKVVRDTGVKVD
jgi:tripartite-type tricarboxylate transporter receptor subunit TctC